MSSIFDSEVRRLDMRGRVITQNDNGLRIWIFSQKLPFSVGKKCFKKYNTLYLYVILQIIPTLYGFRGVAAQRNRALPLVV